MRFDEGGRYVVCCKKLGEDRFDVTPEGFNSRSTVHEYGGGAFFVYDETVYFCNFKDQKMYTQPANSSATPQPITPSEKEWRYADGCISPKVWKYTI